MLNARALTLSPLGAAITQWLIEADDFQFIAILRSQKPALVAGFIIHATTEPELYEPLRRTLRLYRLYRLIGHLSRLQLENACRAAGLAPIALGPDRAPIRGWRAEPLRKAA